MIPVLEFRLEGEDFSYRYTEVVEGFDMPLRIFVDGEPRWIFPSSKWKSEKIGYKDVPQFDENFYVETRKL